ncbi:MAG: transcriptional regulator [Candidatus Buchananbacteria bacterium CG10_big_fil_rev_8_21_14_0_10_42_9]|uniref:Transcriptional regulator n=1 Tax=Candidatus Buchananbacteria bacterium CG10_big_fil_rev_8_21_14_0_10_42_9 TaxID=1974526 RepID=A0A2H0VZZ5_9BACT|nr:MAG: transcriptional regulator [Candidatus Buchananbacteria bacterium CG10_big_fil_rev_8_21_14_0_10_42_9]
MKNKEKYEWELVDVIQKISRNKKLLHEFLEDLFTPNELAEIPTRWQIVKQLKKGVPQREVALNLHTGIATVTRGARELIDKKGGFNLVYEKLYGKKG